MPWGVAAAVAGSVVSSALAPSPSGGGGGGGGAPDHTYVPTSQPAMDQNFQNYYANYGNVLGNSQYMTNPMIEANLQNQYYNPYASLYEIMAGRSGQIYDQQAGMAQNGANQNYAAANQIYQSAFDPRRDIYNQNVQQLQDNTRAAEYARGIQMSPYGAAVEGDVMQKFQNDWQNQQLARQAQGVQAMGHAQQTGAGLGNTAGQMQIAGGKSIFDSVNNVVNNQNQAVQTYWGNQQPYLAGSNQLQSNALGYMNYGTGAQNQAWNQDFKTQQANANAIGQISGPISSAISNWWGNQSYQVPNYAGYQPDTSGWAGSYADNPFMATGI